MSHANTTVVAVETDGRIVGEAVIATTARTGEPPEIGYSVRRPHIVYVVAGSRGSSPSGHPRHRVDEGPLLRCCGATSSDRQRGSDHAANSDST
jgi:hypothetical protein